MIEQVYTKAFEEHLALFSKLNTIVDDLVRAAHFMLETIRNGNKIMVCGNGGSAADAQHLAAEFVNRFQMERPPLPAMALTVDTSILTSIANDYQFDDIFARQLRALAKPGDVAVGISTSGRSRNVTGALKWARENGIVTIGLGGHSETEMDLYCDIILHVPSPVTARVQECHITVGHIICAHVEKLVFGAR